MVDARAVLAALAIGLATTLLSAWRWCLVARRLGLRLPARKAVADYYRALFLNAVLPAGVLGDVDRAVRHGREEGDVGRGVRAVVLERTAGQVVVVATSVADPARTPVDDPRAVPPGRRGLRRGGRGRRGPRGGRRGRGRETLGAERLGVAPAVRRLPRRRTARAARPRRLAGRRLTSALAFAGHLALFLVAARTAGSAAPVTQLLPLMVLTLLAMGLPLNVGGWGPREGVAALAFGAAGLGAAQGLATAVVYGVLALVASLPGAAVLLVAGTRRDRDAPARR